MKFASDDTRRRVVGWLRQKVDETTVEISDDVATSKSKDSQGDPEVKRGRFDDLEDSDSEEDSTVTIKHEVDQYLEQKTKKGKAFN